MRNPFLTYRGRTGDVPIRYSFESVVKAIKPELEAREQKARKALRPTLYSAVFLFFAFIALLIAGAVTRNGLLTYVSYGFIGLTAADIAIFWTFSSRAERCKKALAVKSRIEESDEIAVADMFGDEGKGEELIKKLLETGNLKGYVLVEGVVKKEDTGL